MNLVVKQEEEREREREQKNQTTTQPLLIPTKITKPF